MRGSWVAAAAVWVLSAIAGTAVIAFSAPSERPGLLSLALAGAVVLTFCIQLATADGKGFTTRLTISTVGALAVLALASLAALAVP